MKFNIILPILSIVVSTSLNAKSRSPEQILEQATVYLFTSPQCKVCNQLNKHMTDSNQLKHIRVTYNGHLYNMPLTTIDPWANNAQYSKSLGFSDSILPQFSLVIDGQILAKKEIKRVDSIPYFKEKDLLPMDQESHHNYKTRVRTFLNSPRTQLDFSNLILNSINVKSPNQTPNLQLNNDIKNINILLIGTANFPTSNPIFTGITLQKIKKYLGGITKVEPITLYGTGKNPTKDTTFTTPDFYKPIAAIDPEKNSVTESANHKKSFTKFNLKAKYTPSKQNIKSFFEHSKKTKTDSNLIVLAGHGSPTGFSTWLNPTNKFTPDDLKSALKNTTNQNILVSGNCYGGIMAKHVTCGFTAARPSSTSLGCWEDTEVGKDLPDFLSLFFKSLNDIKNADLNLDGKVSFSEAHTYAALNSHHLEQPYTTVDALADEYFASNPSELSSSINIKYLRNDLVKNHGSVAEKALVEQLTQSLDSKTNITLKKIRRSVNMGPLTATYTFDPNKDSHNFSNVKLLDLKKLQRWGLPNYVDHLAISYEHSSGHSKVSLVYENTDPLWPVDLKWPSKKDLENILFEQNIFPDLLHTHNGGTVKIGPFSGTVLAYSTIYGLQVSNISVHDHEEFQLFLDKHKLHNDVEVKEINSFAYSDKIQLLYKSQRESEDYASFSKINPPENEFNFVPDETVNIKLLSLAKRLLFKKIIAKKPPSSLKSRLNQVLKCEQQGIAEFLNKKKN
ncbi:MAG: hypothetical protein HOO06_05900 [Bdellovibrionaceae bacterium]|nr:hypothetical protein [Pseudobdellovibrionaceae bacterium]